MTSVVVPASLADRLEALLGMRMRTAVAAVGGHSNLVFEAITADGRAVMVKAANTAWKRSDIQREIAVLGVLDDSSLPVPTVVASSADAEWAVVVTGRIDGRNGLSIVADLRADEDLAVSAGRLMARLLRLVHHSTPRPLPGPAFERAAQVAALAEPLTRSEAPVDVIEALLPALSHVVHQRSMAFVHGDPGLHNVLWGPGPTALSVRGLLDWEMAGWGNPLSDLGWVWWTFALRGLPRVCFDAFANEYGMAGVRALGWSDESVDAVVRAQMAALLVRTEPGTAVREVWIDRVRTLGPLPPLSGA